MANVGHFLLFNSCEISELTLIDYLRKCIEVSGEKQYTVIYSKIFWIVDNLEFGVSIVITIGDMDINQVECFWKLLNSLDSETNYMMYEPKEREQRTNIQQLKNDIQYNVIKGNDFLKIAMENNNIVGFMRAEKGRFNRISHTAYIIIGILKD